MPSNRFANFVDVQYMYVFAISLPYTNPHKYDHYTVSLAHHVIAGWFLKCKLPLRRNFVYYILKGFVSNVQKPFEEGKKFVEPVNEDSSNRKRSSSLTERGTRNRSERPTLPERVTISADDAHDEAVYNFHKELTETCYDFLERHCYSSCSALPKRLPTTDFLLAGGQTKSWLFGNKIISITTSGCSSVAVKNGLCDRCALLCRSQQQSAAASVSQMSNSPNGNVSPEASHWTTKSSDSIEFPSQNKRYTKASLQHNSGQDSESTDVISSTSSSSTATDQPKFYRQPSNDGRFSSSSGSLEAISRRGSNPDTSDNTDGGGRRDALGSGMLQPGAEKTKQACICLCSGWAEVMVRRPTGNMSLVMRIQNQMSLEADFTELPIQGLLNVLKPSFSELYSGSEGAEFDAESKGLQKSDSVFSDSAPVTITTSAAKPVASSLESAKKKSISIEAADGRDEEPGAATKKGAPEPRKTPSAVQQEAVKSDSSSNVLLSGPIDIPKAIHKRKTSSGSFSDVEPDVGDDEQQDVAFDENESKMRNPVRRVNSSPEMSSNWRHPYLTAKSGNAIAATATASGGATHPTSGEDDASAAAGDIEQQQKKKNYCKDMRVSCEAIPEEIADSTPPSHQSDAECKQTKILNLRSNRVILASPFS